MSEIKRYNTQLILGSPIYGEAVDGFFVKFTDAEAAIIKAKIEVLEELNDGADFYCDSTTGDDAHWSVRQKEIVAKIKQLQAQLGEAGR